MAGWRPPDSTPLDEIREARSALAGAREFLAAEQGRPGRVDLAVLTCGNSLALQLLHDALGYRTSNVRKRSARSAIATASRVLEEVSKGRDPTVEEAVFRSLSLANKPPSARARGEVVIKAGKQVASKIRASATGEEAQRDQRGPAMPPRPSEGGSVLAHETSSTQIRRLTDDGLRRAREFLAHMRESPSANRQPPRALLFDERYSREFREPVRIDRRAFETRREVADYFVPKFESIRHLVVDDARLWSWLGMFYFADTVRVENGEARLSPLDETFVVHRDDSRSYMLRFRHYLWGSWRLYETHGESVSFLLDHDLTSFGDIFQRTFGAIRIFNSDGIIQLVLRLYTNGMRQKRGFGHAPGGLRHLLRVLDQLERTYDIYGMSPDALLTVLPEEFQRWDNGSAQRMLDAAAEPDLVGGGVEPSPASTAGGPAHGSTGSPRTDVPVPQANSFPPQGDSSSEPDELSRPRPSVRQTLLDVCARIEQQGQVSWADPREHLDEGSEAWEAYVGVCGVPERRLFRTAFLHRLNEVLASLD